MPKAWNDYRKMIRENGEKCRRHDMIMSPLRGFGTPVGHLSTIISTLPIVRQAFRFKKQNA